MKKRWNDYKNGIPAGPEITLIGPRGSTFPRVKLEIPGWATTVSLWLVVPAARGFKPLATTWLVAFKYGDRFPDLETTLIIVIIVIFTIFRLLHKDLSTEKILLYA